MIKVSVIIPVYGVEKFIERCAASLMEQSLKEDVEYIFIDDATKDRSRILLENVISRYPDRRRQVKIITHDKNKGLPAARNTGIGEAVGEYIYHFDGDDFADPDLLSRMLETAVKTDADYIWSDWFLSYENNERYMSQPDAENPEQALGLMLSGKLKYNVWNKLVKRSLYLENNIYFPEGHSMGEDMTMIRLLSVAKTVAKAPGGWYHYIKTNVDAMTRNCFTGYIDDIRHNVELVSDHLRKVGINNYEKLISKFKLSTKYPFLYSCNFDDYHKWEELWPESNKYISLEDGFRNWAIQMCGKHKLYIMLDLHYRLYEFLYNKLYK